MNTEKQTQEVNSRQAMHGVDFSPKNGVQCPMCCSSEMAPGYTKVMKWEGYSRERYHKCARCHTRFKSVEVDPTIFTPSLCKERVH